MLSSFAILVLLPLFIVIIVILKLTGEHHVFYRQDRIGKNGQPFKLLKFATMLANSPKIGTGEITVKNDPRVLPMGRILRKTKLNELPQLFNVLTGDMSIIGPRPVTAKHYFYYSPEGQDIIKKMLPGLSGIGSLVFRDEESFIGKTTINCNTFYQTEIAPYKEALEIWYFNHRGIWTDFKIVLLTIWVIIFPSSQLQFRIFKNLPPKPTWIKD